MGNFYVFAEIISRRYSSSCHYLFAQAGEGAEEQSQQGGIYGIHNMETTWISQEFFLASDHINPYLVCISSITTEKYQGSLGRGL